MPKEYPFTVIPAKATAKAGQAGIQFFILLAFLVNTIGPMPVANAQAVINLPVPGTMVNLSPAFEPVLIKGLKVHPENPFLFDFIIDTGNVSLPLVGRVREGELKQESSKLIKYFLAAMTVPEKDLWVNLSPYEKDRMIAKNLGQTEMGRDMLAQDYILKQLTASLIYPEKHLGKIFWDEIYAKARQMYGTTQIPINTFNKVWIVADKADVFEHGNVAYVVGAHLKVMLEEDYLVLSKNQSQPRDMASAVSPSTLPSEVVPKVKTPQENHRPTNNNTHSIASQIIRQIILPQIEQEVNNGQNFAPLRQMFYSMILASWYKMALKDAILTQIYGNKSKLKGLGYKNSVILNEAKNLDDKDAIFQRYLQAYKKGVFNYIKDDLNPDGQTIPRKYFSGGTNFAMLGQVLRGGQPWPGDSAMKGSIFDVNVNAAMHAETIKSSIDITRAPTVQDLSDSYINDLSDIFSHKSILNAEDVPWIETVHDPQQQPSVDVLGFPNEGKETIFSTDQERIENQRIYWLNQKRVRIEFLKLLADIHQGRVKRTGDLNDPQTIRNRLARINTILLTGYGSNIYISPSMPRKTGKSLEEYKQAVKNEIAGQYAYPYPDPFGDQQSGWIYDALCKFSELSKTNPDLRQITDSIVDVYLSSVSFRRNPFLFVYGNNSMFMNLSNALLRLYVGHGISHYNMDTLYVRNWFDGGRIKNLFFQKVKEANPNLAMVTVAGLGKNLDAAMKEHVDTPATFTKGLLDDHILPAAEIQRLISIYPYLDWENAKFITGRELVRFVNDEDFGKQGLAADWYKRHPQAIAAYVRNQIDLRREFLYFLERMQQVNLTSDDFIEEMKRMHRILLLGKGGDSYYFPPSMSKYEYDLAVEDLKEMAGRIAVSPYFEPMDRKKYFLEQAWKHLQNYMQLKKGQASQELVLKEIAMFLQCLITPKYIFHHGNFSLYMNLTNALLRLQGLPGVPHENLDGWYLKEGAKPGFGDIFISHVDKHSTVPNAAMKVIRKNIPKYMAPKKKSSADVALRIEKNMVRLLDTMLLREALHQLPANVTTFSQEIEGQLEVNTNGQFAIFIEQMVDDLPRAKDFHVFVEQKTDRLVNLLSAYGFHLSRPTAEALILDLIKWEVNLGFLNAANIRCLSLASPEKPVFAIMTKALGGLGDIAKIEMVVRGLIQELDDRGIRGARIKILIGQQEQEKMFILANDLKQIPNVEFIPVPGNTINPHSAVLEDVDAFISLVRPVGESVAFNTDSDIENSRPVLYVTLNEYDSQVDLNDESKSKKYSTIATGFEEGSIGFFINPFTVRLYQETLRWNDRERERQKQIALQEALGELTGQPAASFENTALYAAKSSWGFMYLHKRSQDFLTNFNAYYRNTTPKGPVTVFTFLGPANTVSPPGVDEFKRIEEDMPYDPELKFYDLRSDPQLIRSIDFSKPGIRVINLGVCSLPLNVRFMALSDLPVGVTGDESLMAALLLRKRFLYEAMSWKTKLFENLHQQANLYRIAGVLEAFGNGSPDFWKNAPAVSHGFFQLGDSVRQKSLYAPFVTMMLKHLAFTQFIDKERRAAPPLTQATKVRKNHLRRMSMAIPDKLIDAMSLCVGMSVMGFIFKDTMHSSLSAYTAILAAWFIELYYLKRTYKKVRPWILYYIETFEIATFLKGHINKAQLAQNPNAAMKSSGSTSNPDDRLKKEIIKKIGRALTPREVVRYFTDFLYPQATQNKAKGLAIIKILASEELLNLLAQKDKEFGPGNYFLESLSNVSNTIPYIVSETIAQHAKEPQAQMLLEEFSLACLRHPNKKIKLWAVESYYPLSRKSPDLLKKALNNEDIQDQIFTNFKLLKDNHIFAQNFRFILRVMLEDKTRKWNKKIRVWIPQIVEIMSEKENGLAIYYFNKIIPKIASNNENIKPIFALLISLDPAAFNQENFLRALATSGENFLKGSDDGDANSFYDLQFIADQCAKKGKPFPSWVYLQFKGRTEKLKQYVADFETSPLRDQLKDVNDTIKRFIEAMTTNFYGQEPVVERPYRQGGIDLTRSRLNVHKQGQGMQMQFDQAMIARIRREGFDGLEFHIQSIVPVTNLPLLLGLENHK